MFDHLLLLADDGEGIVVQTRVGTDVPNDIAPAPRPQQVTAYNDAVRPGHLSWQPRRPPGGRYNCHGLSFANRRTSIREDEWILRILQDDGYRELVPAELPMPGDLAIYRNPLAGILHSALVVSPPPPELAVPETCRVLSKWADWGGEELHAANDPHLPGFDWSIRFWTDRP